MNATESKLPTATGNIPDNGASLKANISPLSKARVPIVVKEKCKNDKKTMNWNPSTSVMYLLVITTPTTDRMFTITPIIITVLDIVIV